MGTETEQHFSRETAGLPDAVPSRLVEVAEGERIQ